MLHRSEGSLRREICDAGRALYERGLIGPLDGNVSARLGDRYLLCTPTGSHKGELRPDDLVKLTLDGRVVTPGARPSSEILMHLEIYGVRPDVAAIVHAHPPCAVGLTVAGVSLDKPVVPEILFAIGEVPNVPYSSPTTRDVPEAIRAVLSRCDAFMLARHGSVCLGPDPRRGVIMTETIEHTARITLAAKSAGGGSPLPPAEVSKLLGLAQAARGGVTGREAEVVEAVTRAVLAKLKG